MKKQFILVLVCLFISSVVVGCGSSDSKKDELKTFTPEGKNFSADFPGDPKADSFTVESPYGEQVTDTYIYEGKYTMLSLSSTELPDALLLLDHGIILTNSANGAVINAKGTDQEITDITVLDQPAKSYKCSIKTPEDQTLIIEGHVVIIDKTLYTLQYMSDEKNWDRYKEERETFFNSLAVNK
jgi:hypothetical protein